jgi:hypothetical protein
MKYQFSDLDAMHAVFQPGSQEFNDAQKIINTDGSVTVKTGADKDPE